MDAIEKLYQDFGVLADAKDKAGEVSWSEKDETTVFQGIITETTVTRLFRKNESRV